MLAAILDPAHGMAELEREPGERDLLAAQQALVAEAAADIGRDDADRAVREAEALGKPGLHDVRHLRRGDDGEIAQTVVPPGEHAAALERQHALARGADFAGHRDGRGGRCGLDPGAPVPRGT